MFLQRTRPCNTKQVQRLLQSNSNDNASQGGRVPWSGGRVPWSGGFYYLFLFWANHLLSIIRGNFHILENSWDLQCLVWFGKQLGTLSTRKTSGNLDMKSSWRGHSDSCVRIISIYMIPTGVPEICGNASVLCANLKGCDESEIIGAGAAVSWICWLIIVHTLYLSLIHIWRWRRRG